MRRAMGMWSRVPLALVTTLAFIAPTSRADTLSFCQTRSETFSIGVGQGPSEKQCVGSFGVGTYSVHVEWERDTTVELSASLQRNATELVALVDCSIVAGVLVDSCDVGGSSIAETHSDDFSRDYTVSLSDAAESKVTFQSVYEPATQNVFVRSGVGIVNIEPSSE